MDIRLTVNEMTDEEKCRLLAGRSFWTTQEFDDLGIPSITLADGPHGLRKQAGNHDDHMGLNESVPATCFPTASALACSFDEELVEAVGAAIAEECRNQDVAVLLGPGANVKRNPLCGRNFEYFSEDPLLSGRSAAAFIRGAQGRGVGTALKHFAGNSQETHRMTSDSVIDERALREVYLRSFEIAVKEGHPSMVMTAYNKLNGTYCGEHRALITDILRDEWRFGGATVTDWGGLNDSVASVDAGLDLAMPGPLPSHVADVNEALVQGNLSQETVDAAVERILQLVDRSTRNAQTPFECNIDEHLTIARIAAEQSAVLLKNDGTLPLRKTSDICIIGAFAKHPRYQGAGSSKINPIALDCAWDALSERLTHTEYAAGYDHETGETTEALLHEAELVAERHRHAVMFVGLPDSYESEGADRETMELPAGQIELIERVAAVNPSLVVVLQGGSPVATSWAQHARSVLLMYLSGCRGGHATANILLGDCCPSGKLAETWPLALEDCACADEFPSLSREIHYRESLLVGYRYFDAARKDVAYPFGFGLSYTTFAYSDIEVFLRDGATHVAFSLTNTGNRRGRETVQVYVTPIKATVPKARQTLQAFRKILLDPGETKRVQFTLQRRAFTHYDTTMHDWVIEAGDYEIRIAASSRDIRLRDVVHLHGVAPTQGNMALLCYYDPTRAPFDEAAFAQMYGRPFPQPQPAYPFTRNSTLDDIKDTRIGGLIIKLLNRRFGKISDAELLMHMKNAAHDMPARGLTMAGVSQLRIDGLIDMANTDWISGIRKFIKGRK